LLPATSSAGFSSRWKLAKMAHEETGLGIVHDKMVKNIIATRYVYKDIINQKR